MGGSKEKAGRNLHTAHRESQDLINLFKASEMCYQDLFNNASDAIFIRNLKGNIIEVNVQAGRGGADRCLRIV